MLTDLQTAQLSELLHQLDKDDITALAKTVTSTLLIPKDYAEAINVIIQYSPSVASLLARKKITKEVVFRYLHKKKVPGISPAMTKSAMVQIMVVYWDREVKKDNKRPAEVKVKDEVEATPAKKPAHSAEPEERKVTIVKPTEKTQEQTDDAPAPDVKPSCDRKQASKVTEKCVPEPEGQIAKIKSASKSNDEYASDDDEEMDHQTVMCRASDFDIQLFSEVFTKWFYNLFNIGESISGQKFGPEHFWPDNFLQLRVTGPNINVQEERFTGLESAALLAQMRSRFDLYLNPNISREGIVAQSESHGIIKITVCGTAHKHDLCIGFFEQSFMIIKDPMMENNWRIKKTEIQMKTTIDSKSGRADTSAMALIPLLQ